jgi:WhiB family redox-sensing transcriptional regulator
MMIRTSSREQVREWLQLAKACDEVGDDHLPCRQAPDLYFASQSEHYYTRLAVEACKRCPLMQQCGEYAIRHNETEGVWGGLTVGERKRMRRSLRK